VDGGGNTAEGRPDARWCCDGEGEREREREREREARKWVASRGSYPFNNYYYFLFQKFNYFLSIFLFEISGQVARGNCPALRTWPIRDVELSQTGDV